jgi:regulator of sirC expression with transglutaminase-like and TPR domain
MAVDQVPVRVLDTDLAEALRAVGSQDDDDIDLAGAALLLARAGRPEAPPAPYLRHLEQIVIDIGDYAGPAAKGGDELARRHEALVQVIARRYGYAGTQDAFDQLDAANLMRAVDRRSGLPVTLGILYIDAARKLGWQASGIDFPGRFLVRIEAMGERRMIDPFDQGVEVDAAGLRRRLKDLAGEGAELKPHYYAAMSARAVLLRLEGNIRVRLVAQQRWEEASALVARMLLIAPGDAALWREQGMLHARLDRVQAAIAALEESLRFSTEEPARYRTSALIQELRRRLP